MKKPNKKTAKKSAKPAAKAKQPAKKVAAKLVAKKPAAKVEPAKKKTEADQVLTINLTDIVTGGNYRTIVVDEKLKELSTSIKQQGLIQPVTVKPIADQPGKYTLVAGERRYKATELAGLKTIRALLSNAEANADTRITQLVENLQRSDVHPMDEAIRFKELTTKKEGQKKADYTAETLAAAISKSKSYVFKRMKLVSLCQKGQELFRKETISYNHALLLARLENDVQLQAIEWMMDEESGEPFNSTTKTLEQLRDYLQEELFIDISEAPFDLLDTELVKGCAACIVCPKRTINNSDFPKPEGWDESEAYDKCTDKGCFFKKTEAHLLAVIAENTVDGKAPQTGSVHYEFDTQVKIGSVLHLFSKKKTKEYAIPVVISKQVNGREMIGTVVFIQSEEAKAEAKKAAKEQVQSPLQKTTRTSKYSNENTAAIELENKQNVAKANFVLRQVKTLVGAALFPKKSPFVLPYASCKELAYYLIERANATQSDTEEFTIQLILRAAFPDKSDDVVRTLFQDLQTGFGKIDVVKIDEAEKISESLEKLKLSETTILQIMRMVAIAGMESEDDNSNPVTIFNSLRAAGLNPEKLQEEFVKTELEKEVAAQEA
jgi:ParB/RepB/Spo0J family partition protein